MATLSSIPENMAAAVVGAVASAAGAPASAAAKPARFSARHAPVATPAGAHTSAADMMPSNGWLLAAVAGGVLLLYSLSRLVALQRRVRDLEARPPVDDIVMRGMIRREVADMVADLEQSIRARTAAVTAAPPPSAHPPRYAQHAAPATAPLAPAAPAPTPAPIIKASTAAAVAPVVTGPPLETRAVPDVKREVEKPAPLTKPPVDEDVAGTAPATPHAAAAAKTKAANTSGSDSKEVELAPAEADSKGAPEDDAGTNSSSNATSAVKPPKRRAASTRAKKVAASVDLSAQ